MGEELADSLRREVDDLRAELADRARAAAKGTALLASAGASGSLAVAAVSTLPLLALRRVLPGWLIGLLVAAGASALTTQLARRGLDELRAAAPAEVDRVKAAAREAVRSVA